MDMEPVVCPNCNAKIPDTDLVAGWCEACGKHIPDWLVSKLPYNRTHQTRTHGGPGSSQNIPAIPVASGHKCALCGETTMDALTGYLCPTPTALAANPSSGRWAIVRCFACATCYERGREIRLNQQIVAGWAVASIVAAVLATAGIAVLGASWVLYPIVAGLLALSLLICAIYLRLAPARQTGPWLGKLDPVMRAALCVPVWSYFATVRITQTHPAGETATDLDELVKPDRSVPASTSRPAPVAAHPV